MSEESKVPVDTSGPLPLNPPNLDLIPQSRHNFYAQLMDGTYELRSLSYDDRVSVQFYTTGRGADQLKQAGRVALPVLEAGDTPQRKARRDAEKEALHAKWIADADKSWHAGQARLRKEAEEREVAAARARFGH